MLDNQKFALEQFEELRNHLKKWTEKSNFNEGDIRYDFPNQLDKILLYHNLNSFYFLKILSDKRTLDKIIYTPTNSDYFQLIETYQIQNKNSLIFALSGILENFCRVLHKKIFIENNEKKKFHQIKKEIFNFLNLEIDDKWVATSILANIRNTFHNNGIHTSQDFPSINYKEKIYQFKKNEYHYNADYDTLFNITNDIFNLYLKIIERTQVKEIEFISR